MRICSLLPSATEVLFALGLDDEIVGVSHECDYPPEALDKPRVIRTTLDQERMASDEIDVAVREAMAHKRSLYEVDVEALCSARPDLIVTQELCDVCAIDTAAVTAVLRALPFRPQILSLHPHTLEEVLEDLRRIGEATGRLAEAQRLLASLRDRLERVRSLVADAGRLRVFCVEWLAPPMASGHWVPEQVAWAGGVEVLGRAGAPSRYVSPEEILDAQPEALVLMPCGFPVERTRRELSLLTAQPWWKELAAVRAGRVHLVDGPAYFNRSGPRLVDGIELLASLLHPKRCVALSPGRGSAATI